MFILTQLRQCRSALRWHHKSSGYSRPRFSQSTSSHSQRAWCCLQRSRGWGRCAATSDGRSAYRRQNSPQRNVNFPLENIFTNPAVGAEGFVFGAEAKPGSGLPLPIKPPLVKVCPVLVVIWWSAILRGVGPERSIWVLTLVWGVLSAGSDCLGEFWFVVGVSEDLTRPRGSPSGVDKNKGEKLGQTNDRKGLPSVHILRQLAEGPRPRHNKSPDLVNEILREPLMIMMIIATGSKVPKPREKVKAAFTGWL